MNPTEQRIYPHGVTCWVDLKQPDPEAATAFYSGLFGWTFENAVPSEAPTSYLIAKLDGADVGAIGTGDGNAWDTYIAVDDAEVAAKAVTSAGGNIVEEPAAGPGGITATCKDPNGAEFHLWQAHARLGAQVANVPNAWNFSNLHTANAEGALDFYSSVFGWQTIGDDPELGVMVRVPGYGNHLESTVDPGIRERQKFAPEGFEDVIGGIAPRGENENEHWHVIFAVADRDESASKAEALGGTAVGMAQNQWALTALVRDPSGAEFSLSQFAPQY